MRNVPSSVAVITVASEDPEMNKQVPMGVAVSSLSTVTLDPPTISFNIKEPSKTLSAIREANGLFRVHFPRGDKGGASIVDHFCRGNHPDAYNIRIKDLKLHMPSGDDTKTSTLSRAPQLLDDSILAGMECTVTHEFPVADHVIVVARVDSMEHKATKEPAIIYVDGGYRRTNGDPITNTGKPKPLTVNGQVWSAWDYPLFPGAQERQDYIERIKTIVKETPAYHNNPGKDTIRKIESDLPYSPSSFGINLHVLVAECRQELGLQKEVDHRLAGQSTLCDFYGQLTPSTRQKIVERAKKLLAADEMFLTQEYRGFLYNLGVSPVSRDFLPSDIMEPLRAAGLAEPFEPRKGGHPTTTNSILEVEQIEHRVREYLSKMPYETALTTKLETAMEALGEKKGAAFYFKKARSRLLTQTHPELFAAPLIDIAGEVTQEEMRVVICRLIILLKIRSLTHFRKALALDWCEALRIVRVNPTISGMDVGFLMGKIKHLYYSSHQYRDFPPAVDQMLEPFFDRTVTWEDLEDRVRQFVQKLPLRATAWSNNDRLAAMGLHWAATVTLPTQESLPNPQGNRSQPLNQGHILETLVAKELRNYYGKGTVEENNAIKTYLLDTYSFDVTQTQTQTQTPKPREYVPGAQPEQSSGDELKEAMLAHTAVNEQPQQRQGQLSHRPRFASAFTNSGDESVTSKPYGSRLSRKPMGKNLLFRKV
jgi:flavin reductase (DIM6/NTAB) family NADH-FMN oxidoreductase RutF